MAKMDRITLVDLMDYGYSFAQAIEISTIRPSVLFPQFIGQDGY